MFHLPIYSVSRALYQALKNGGAGGLQWFDGGSTIKEVETEFKNQAQFFYGIIGAAEADQNDRADDIWDVGITLEIYSNYSGRKIVSQKLQALLDFLSQDSTWNTMDGMLNADGFQIIRIDLGPYRINLPIIGDNGNWQSASVQIVFKVNQT